jgi:hypothetical protein
MAEEICKKNGAKTQSKGETTIAKGQLNSNEVCCTVTNRTS